MSTLMSHKYLQETHNNRGQTTFSARQWSDDALGGVAQVVLSSLS